MNGFSTIIGGAILGLLGRSIAPGDKDNIPTWLTILSASWEPSRLLDLHRLGVDGRPTASTGSADQPGGRRRPGDDHFGGSRQARQVDDDPV